MAITKKMFESNSNNNKKRKITHNLKLDRFAIQFNGTDLEVHTNGANVAFGVGVILKIDIALLFDIKAFLASEKAQQWRSSRIGVIIFISNRYL